MASVFQLHCISTVWCRFSYLDIYHAIKICFVLGSHLVIRWRDYKAQHARRISPRSALLPG